MTFLIPQPAEDAVAAPTDKERELAAQITAAIQRWLAQLLSHALAEYAEKKEPKNRSLQSGHAWSAFLETFGPPNGPGLLHVCLALYRFARAHDPLAPILSDTAAVLSFEHDSSGEFLGPRNPDLSDPAQAILLTRQTIRRWCDWIDAAVHLQTHSYWHHHPVCFDPDPEKRDLACLGVVQRRFALQTSQVKALWHQVYSDAVEHYKNSHKWPKLGQAMASDQHRPWPYRELDIAIISLWPLLKRHNWTYRDLINVILALNSDSVLRIPHSALNYPCQREQDFTVHCRTVLGLRKTGRGKTTKNALPLGHEIARKLFIAALHGLMPLRPQP
jgi:hypothetical protein